METIGRIPKPGISMARQSLLLRQRPRLRRCTRGAAGSPLSSFKGLLRLHFGAFYKRRLYYFLGCLYWGPHLSVLPIYLRNVPGAPG